MKLIKPSYEIKTDLGQGFLEQIEVAGRLCYKSEENITHDSAKKFVAMLLKREHEAMLEHAPSISVKFIANRGFTHEIVRMRLASFAQESTRYCNYSKDKFNGQVTFCLPKYISESELLTSSYEIMCDNIEDAYLKLLKLKVPAQIARDILPIGIKAEIIVTANVREWRHILKLRTADVAHPIMHELMRPLCKELQEKIPVLFDDIRW